MQGLGPNMTFNDQPLKQGNLQIENALLVYGGQIKNVWTRMEYATLFNFLFHDN